jgi:flagella basal body P-ring formation protein FlgA
VSNGLLALITRWLRAVLVVAISVMVVTPAFGATIRLNATGETADTLVRLRDIATISDADARTIAALGAAVVGESAPPGHMRIVLPADVVTRVIGAQCPSCRVEGHTSERIEVRTSFRSIKIDDFADTIASAIGRSISWAPGTFEISVPSPSQDAKLYPGPCQATVGSRLPPKAKGTQQVTLILRQAARTLRIPVGVKIIVRVPVLVTTRQVARGVPVTASDCTVKIVDITNYGYDCYTDLSQLASHITNRTISAGTVLHEMLVRPVPLIQRGDQVMITTRQGLISVSVLASARENGCIGDHIWVENMQTHQLVRGIVTAKGTVELATQKESSI